MADQIKGVPAGLVEEQVQAPAQVQGVPAGLVAEQTNTPDINTFQKLGLTAMTDQSGQLQGVPHAQVAQKMQQGWQVGPPQQQNIPLANIAPNQTVMQKLNALDDGTRNVLRRGAAGLGDAAKSLISLPGNVYHAATDDPTNDEERSQYSLSGPVGLAVQRLVVNPSIDQYQKSKEAFTQGHISEGLGHAGGVIPLIGPWANNAGEAIGNDPVRGLSELFGNILIGAAIPKIPGVAGKTLSKVGTGLTDNAETLGNAVAHPQTTVQQLVQKGVTKTIGGAGNILNKMGNAIAPEAPVVPSVPAPPEAAPAPYRMSGDQITNPVTVTPKAPFVPKGLLNAAPVEDDAPAAVAPMSTPASPKAAQTAILKKMGVASPAATIKPMTRVPTAEIVPRPDLSFAGSNSGESAAMNQLSENFSPQRLGINDLRGIAMSRGIPVDPADSHVTLINKIHDSLTPDELDKFDQAVIERMQPNYSLPSQ